jgi:hypothetical protein
MEVYNKVIAPQWKYVPCNSRNSNKTLEFIMTHN